MCSKVLNIRQIVWLVCLRKAVHPATCYVWHPPQSPPVCVLFSNKWYFVWPGRNRKFCDCHPPTAVVYHSIYFPALVHQPTITLCFASVFSWQTWKEPPSLSVVLRRTAVLQCQGQERRTVGEAFVALIHFPAHYSAPVWFSKYFPRTPVILYPRSCVVGV